MGDVHGVPAQEVDLWVLTSLFPHAGARTTSGHPGWRPRALAAPPPLNTPLPLGGCVEGGSVPWTPSTHTQMPLLC